MKPAVPAPFDRAPVRAGDEHASLSPSDPHPNDAEDALLRAHREGDPHALEQLLLSVQPRLLALCFRMSRDPQQAHDLCQDALVKIIQGLPAFTGRSRLTTWMIRVTMNVCLTALRRSALRHTAALDAQPHDADSARTDHAPPTREPAPPERVERREDLTRLSRALALLDPDQRALLILRDAQGLDYAQIADITSAPIGTIKSRLYRARQALRQTIERLTP